MKKLLTTILSITLLATAMPVMAKGKYKSCKAFDTQPQAQAYYNKRKKAGQNGWKGLDRDKDGQACDCLPEGNPKYCK